VSDERGLALAYRYLNRRERTASETRAHLQARDVDDGTAERVIAILAEQGYLDDRRFARLFVQDKRELEQWGDERIRRGLESRGIERELAAEAIAENGGYGRELERAVALLRRRVPNPEPDRRGRERALGLLMRRGYDYELAADAVRTHLSG
jgi:regulatory protein